MKEIALPVAAPAHVYANINEAYEAAKALPKVEGHEWEVMGNEAEEWHGRFVNWKIALVNVEVAKANEENVAYGGYAKWNAIVRYF